jgi:1,4-alpha-glucan branching enzyme
MCANHLAKMIDKNVILVAEDVSGLPGLCRSLEDGGVGFNFRLAMSVPDMWVKFLKEIKDEDWDID